METLALKPQEIPFDHPDSCNMFEPSREKPIVATTAALATFGPVVIAGCIQVLQRKAKQHHGIDRLQIFTTGEAGKVDLWFIDGPGEAITAMLPSDY